MPSDGMMGASDARVCVAPLAKAMNASNWRGGRPLIWTVTAYHQPDGDSPALSVAISGSDCPAESSTG